MCGVVGYVGNEPKAIDVVLGGLSTLEYRGYDSAGIAFMRQGKIAAAKQTGRVQALRDSLNQNHVSTTAIGHTRWATHGAPTTSNAHPHHNTAKTIAVVHNGIIENYAELRDHLQEQGYIFASETDTEVIPHLIDFYRQSSKTFEEAFTKTLRQLRGAYALAVIRMKIPMHCMLLGFLALWCWGSMMAYA